MGEVKTYSSKTKLLINIEGLNERSNKTTVNTQRLTTARDAEI